MKHTIKRIGLIGAIIVLFSTFSHSNGILFSSDHKVFASTLSYHETNNEDQLTSRSQDHRQAILTINKTTDHLKAGSSDYLHISGSPFQHIQWTSSNPGVVKVSSFWGFAKVTAVSEGTATITATSADGSKTSACTVIVKNPVVSTSITFNNTIIDLTMGGNSVTASVTPYHDIRLTSSNPDVIKVSNDDGTEKLTVVGKGTASITATTADGSKNATATVRAKNSDISSLIINRVSIGTNTLTVNQKLGTFMSMVKVLSHVNYAQLHLNDLRF